MDYLGLWIAILGAALGTFMMRISFLGPWASGHFPKWLEVALKFAPPIVFAALITPMILKMGTEVPTAQRVARITAAGATLLWALRYGGQVWPLVVGMVTLHSMQALIVR